MDPSDAASFCRRVHLSSLSLYYHWVYWHAQRQVSTSDICLCVSQGLRAHLASRMLIRGPTKALELHGCLR